MSIIGYQDDVSSTIGVIGTGLFLGTAGGLQNGGPVGLLLGYACIGSICYAVMVGQFHTSLFARTDKIPVIFRPPEDIAR